MLKTTVGQFSSLEAPGLKLKKNFSVSCLSFIWMAYQLSRDHRLNWASPCTDSSGCYLFYCLCQLAVEGGPPVETKWLSKIQWFLRERKEEHRNVTVWRWHSSSDLSSWLKMKLVLEWFLIWSSGPEFSVEIKPWHIKIPIPF